MNLTKIASDIAELDIPMGDETLHIKYYPGRVTERMFSILRQLDSLQGMADEQMMLAFEQAFSDFNGLLASVLKSWSFYEDAEETVMFPIDARRFSEIALGFRMAVFNAIMGDIRPEALAAQQNGKSPH